MAMKMTDDTNYTNIAEAIREKLGVATKWLPSEMPGKIREIVAGEPDWRDLGFSEAPNAVMDAFEYAEAILDSWDSSVTYRRNQFNGDKTLFYFPRVDMSNVTDTQGMFSESNLQSYTTDNLSDIQNAAGMFGNCGCLSEAYITVGEKNDNYFYKKIEAESQITEVLFSEIPGYTYTYSDNFRVIRNGEYLTTSDPSQYSISSTKITLSSSYYLESGDVLEIKIFKTLADLYKIFAGCKTLKTVEIDCGNRVGRIAEAFKDTTERLNFPILSNTMSISDISYMFSANWYLRPSSSLSLSFPNCLNAVRAFSEVGRYGDTSLNPISLDLPICTNTSEVFLYCIKLLSGSIYAPNSKNYSGAFVGCTDIQSVSIDLSSATNIHSIFEGCEKLTSNNIEITYNLEPVQDIKLYDASLAFKACKMITSLPELNGLDGVWTFEAFAEGCIALLTTPSAELTARNLKRMFYGCTSLASINYEFSPDAPKFNSGEYLFSEMFRGCSSLTAAPIINKIGSDESGARSITNVQMSDMFNNCTSLVDVDEIEFGSSVNCNPNTSGMFSGCNSLSDASVNNILKMCINIKNATNNTRSLSSMGFTNTYYPVSRLEQLSNYDDFLSSGCTVGYS